MGNKANLKLASETSITRTSSGHKRATPTTLRTKQRETASSAVIRHHFLESGVARAARNQVLYSNGNGNALDMSEHGTATLQRSTVTGASFRQDTGHPRQEVPLLAGTRHYK
ncbi:hypothetical protein J6590_036479 [Homalodisca vitripennis]|nr:hypothetical protein J6590_036479 [Homalodisca vitripennis]